MELGAGKRRVPAGRKDPFSEINMDRTLLAYRRLCACLTIVGNKRKLERVFNDGAYAEELF